MSFCNTCPSDGATTSIPSYSTAGQSNCWCDLDAVVSVDTLPDLDEAHGNIVYRTPDDKVYVLNSQGDDWIELTNDGGGSSAIDQQAYIVSSNMAIGPEGNTIVPNPGKPLDLTRFIDPANANELAIPLSILYGGQSTTVVMDIPAPFNVEVYGHIDGEYENILYKKSLIVTKSVIDAPVEFRGHPYEYELRVVIDANKFTSDISGHISVMQHGPMLNPNKPSYYNREYDIVIPKSVTPVCDYSGTYGTSDWCINGDTLTFYAGEFPDSTAESGGAFPWDDHKAGITTIEFAGEVTLAKNSTGLFWQFPDLVDLSGVENVLTYNTTSFSGTFGLNPKLVSVDISAWSLKAGTDFSHMFQGCDSLENVNLGIWSEPVHANTMNSMFEGCSNLVAINMSEWVFDFTGTSEVNPLSDMFTKCTSLTSVDLSGFITEGVENAYEGVFSDATALTQVTIPDTFVTPVGIGGLALPNATETLKWQSDTNVLLDDIYNSSTDTPGTYELKPYTPPKRQEGAE